VAILEFGFFAILKSTSGGREAPAKELVTESILRAASVPKPPLNGPMAAFLSPASTQLTTLVQSTVVDRRAVPLRARDQNGCDTRLRGERGKRASSMPRPATVTTGLEVGPSTVCLLSSDMAEFAMGYASLVGRH
jgi:hypothetical protein